jgi:glycosyltransferase involved in cell wall biosynthesis
MKVACLCCTYNRPKELANALQCFANQDYPANLCELIVLDDAGQYDVIPLLVNLAKQYEYINVKLVSTRYRFRTLGEKRNACAGLASPEIEAFCVWDDDDSYLPWHVSAHVQALQTADYVIPSCVYLDKKTRLERKQNTYMFHGGWSFTREAFQKVNGYPFMQSGQDKVLFERFKAAKLERGDTLQFDIRPSYIYSWFTTHKTHISAGPQNSYENLGSQIIRSHQIIRPKLIRNWEQLQKDEQDKCNAITE